MCCFWRIHLQQVTGLQLLQIPRTKQLSSGITTTQRGISSPTGSSSGSSWRWGGMLGRSSRSWKGAKMLLRSGWALICLGEGFAVRRQAENGQIKILSNWRLFQLVRAAELEVPDTPDIMEMVSSCSRKYFSNGVQHFSQ